MLGYLSAAATCLAAMVLIYFDLWSLTFHDVSDYLYLFPKNSARGAEKLLSKEELSRYTGVAGSPGLYLSVVGQVFDVQKGREHYGPGGSYSFFAGKDASRAYVTGDFTENGLVDDVSGLSATEMLILRDWLSFYKKNYIFVGKLVGYFYDKYGEPTAAAKEAEAAMDEGLKLKGQHQEQRKHFPSCNSEWTPASGTRVWCEKKSGGIERDWTGVPRKMYAPGSKGHRCVCVRTTGPPSGHSGSSEYSNRGDLDNHKLQEYEGCHPDSEWCMLKN
uniref:Neuferricin n=1 Tax=Geotrypetes seraphini TaxID=260995 RepID=A0A6P8PPE4_GEOSA|nr:neuferricin [Geotrypetes seraphini]XP_033777381.1 neuferricin [Geotrypetes seraphini]XP_033777382.1 neuferricin [Geotrypetes seraphini]